MRKSKGIHTAVLVLGLSVAGWAFASANHGANPALPPAIQQAISAGATVVFLDAQGNPVWTSSLGLEPRSDLLAAATQVVIYDAQGNAVLTLTVTKGPNGDIVITTPSGKTIEADKLAKAALAKGAYGEDHEGKEYMEKEQNRERNREHAGGAMDDANHSGQGSMDDAKGSDSSNDHGGMGGSKMDDHGKKGSEHGKGQPSQGDDNGSEQND